MNAPIRELPQAARPADIGAEEWALRLELAACYRLFSHLGWTEMIFNHITQRVPGDEPQFLINPYGLHYSEVTARNLVKIDLQGRVIGESAVPDQPGRLRDPRGDPREPAGCPLHHPHAHDGRHRGRLQEGRAALRQLLFGAVLGQRRVPRLRRRDDRPRRAGAAGREPRQGRRDDPAQPRPAGDRAEHPRGVHPQLVAAARLRGAARGRLRCRDRTTRFPSRCCARFPSSRSRCAPATPGRSSRCSTRCCGSPASGARTSPALERRGPPAGRPAPRRRTSVRRRLARPHREVDRLAGRVAAQHLQHAVVVDAAGVQRLVQAVDRIDRDAVEADDQVALAQTGARRRALRLRPSRPAPRGSAPGRSRARRGGRARSSVRRRRGSRAARGRAASAAG